MNRQTILPLDFRLLFAYAGVVSSTCRISFDDGARMTHTVSVAASSLYEAAVLALAEFKKSGFAIAEVGPGTRLRVAVESRGRFRDSGRMEAVNKPSRRIFQL